MSKELSSHENEQRDERSSKQRKIPRRPLSEIVFVDPRKTKRGVVNAKETPSAAPISLKDVVTDRSLLFQNTTGRNVASDKSSKENSSRNRSAYRKSRRKKLEIPSQVDPSLRCQQSRKLAVPLQESQLLEKDLADSHAPQQVRVDDHTFYREAADSVEGLSREAVSSGRRTPLERGKVDSARPVYPNLSSSIFGRSPPPNIQDFPRAIFPLPAFRGIPPGFSLSPQPAQGIGAPPGFYLPFQAKQGNGAPHGYLLRGFFPPPGFAPLSRFYPPPLLTVGTSPPPAIYPLPQGVHGTGISPRPVPQTVFGRTASFGLHPRSQAVLGSTVPLKYHLPSQPTLGTSPSQQDSSRVKWDETLVPTIPPPDPAISSEVHNSVPNVSTSVATTALLPTLPSGSLVQQKPVQPQLSESNPAVSVQDRISEHSYPSNISANVPSAESLEFTPHFTLPIVRLFGGLFVHSCNESHYVTTDSMPPVT